MTLKDVCSELSISYATGKNWVKLGKLIPQKMQGGVPCFSVDYIKGLKEEISAGRNDALKSRRNKRFISGIGMYNSYVYGKCRGKKDVDNLLLMLQEKELTPSADELGYILASCAVRMFLGLNYISHAFGYREDAQKESPFLTYLRRDVSFGKYDELIDALIIDRARACSFALENPEIFDISFTYEEKEDILGLIYISCKNLGSRKAKGSYYTPGSIVKKVTDKENARLDQGSILDPCCGTGNFLLQLPDNVKAENVYGCDIDPVSVFVTRINMALRFPQAEPELIIKHITVRNYLTEPCGRKFDHIIGNPPWGYGYTDSEKAQLRRSYKSAVGSSFDSFDLFVEKALADLEPDGDLTFVLPKAILNVKSHREVRALIKEKTSIERIEYLGEAFDKVNCPSIILKIRNTKEEMTTKGLVISDGRVSFTIDTDRSVDPDNFTFLSTDEEYRLLEKIKNVRDARSLLNNADFALGIVTGNNKEFILKEKTSDNEMVLKGADIFKYRYRQSGTYITFKPKSFQQVAPERYYREKEKLFYRFISNQLVFAYDDKQTLSLNSCNVLIPRIPSLYIKYVLAILNSSVAQFFYTKNFDSVKVLRAHIESIPIPFVDEGKQKELIEQADRLIRDEETDRESIYNSLDEMIFDIFDLTETERKLIRSSVENYNRFL